MAHEHSIVDIYNLKTAAVAGGGDGSINIHNVPNKPWLGKEYRRDHVQAGATQESGLHANPAGDMPGFSLDGAEAATFTATQNEYDTVPGTQKFRTSVNTPDGAGLDDRAGVEGRLYFGGDPTADPYIERDYLENAPGL